MGNIYIFLWKSFCVVLLVCSWNKEHEDAQEEEETFFLCAQLFVTHRSLSNALFFHFLEISDGTDASCESSRFVCIFLLGESFHWDVIGLDIVMNYSIMVLALNGWVTMMVMNRAKQLLKKRSPNMILLIITSRTILNLLDRSLQFDRSIITRHVFHHIYGDHLLRFLLLYRRLEWSRLYNLDWTRWYCCWIKWCQHNRSNSCRM